MGKTGWIYEYSNVSVADYHKIRVHMMKIDGWSMDAAGLSQKQMELLAELEHFRWCRYHQFHNWRMGIPKMVREKMHASDPQGSDTI